METWKYIKFVGTRWYFWAIYILFLSRAMIDPSFSLENQAYALGGLFGMILFASILPTIFWFRKKKQP